MLSSIYSLNPLSIFNQKTLMSILFLSGHIVWGWQSFTPRGQLRGFLLRSKEVNTLFFLFKKGQIKRSCKIWIEMHSMASFFSFVHVHNVFHIYVYKYYYYFASAPCLELNTQDNIFFFKNKICKENTC